MSSVERRLADVDRIQDPVKRAVRLHQVVLPEIEAVRNRGYDARALAVLEANEAGWGYRRLAAELGMSVPRIQQLVDEGRRVRAGESRWKAKPRTTAADRPTD